MGLTVAVTGPTGEIGISAVTALEKDPGVDRILGMARREFDASAHGWTKTEYRRGDILDRSAVADLVADADVVVHLAFLIMGSRTESARINLAGTRIVFEETVAAERPQRLVYTSSVAAYGYHADNRLPITEDTPTRGSDEHYYSQQKAQLEAVLDEVTAGSDLDVVVLRPCVVAGPKAHALADSVLPRPVRSVLAAVPLVRPVIPDPGHPLQLVHHDDVATAIALATSTDAPPGAYNIAADGVVSVSQVASALGALGVRVPSAAVTLASAAVRTMPVVPSMAEWVHATRVSMLVDTSKAKRDLGWHPVHTSTATLDAMAASL